MELFLSLLVEHDPSWTSQQIKIAIMKTMKELLDMDTPKLLNHRMLKFRQLGGFIEGEAVDSAKKVNMKKKEEPIAHQEKIAVLDIDLEMEVENLRLQIEKSKEDSTYQLSDMSFYEMTEKLKKEVDLEYSEAAKFMGLKDSLEMLRKEVTGAMASSERLLDQMLAEKIEKLKQDFEQGLPECPNYDSLSHKLELLKGAQKLSLDHEVSKRFKELMNPSDMKEKVDMLKADIANAGVSKASDLDDDLKEKIMKVKNVVVSSMAKKLKFMNLDVDIVASKGFSIPATFLQQPAYANLKVEIDALSNEITGRIEHAIGSSDLKSRIEILKLEVAKAGKSPDTETVKRVEEMKLQLKHRLADVVSSPSLVEKYKKVKQEIARAMLSLQEELEEDSLADRGLFQDTLPVDNKKLETSRVINSDATSMLYS